MELKFIWTPKFIILKNFQTNFSNSDGDEFDFKDNKLTLQKNKPLLEFGKKVKSITAIAGENGSGKSTLTEAIIRSLATLVNGSMSINVTFNGIAIIDNYIFKQEKIIIENSEYFQEIGYEIKTYKESPLEMLGGHENNFINLGFFYFSTHLDWISDMDEQNLSNYSNQAQLHNDVVRGQFYPQDTSVYSYTYEEAKFQDKIFNLETHFLEENHRRTLFLLEDKYISLIDKHPESISISLSYSGNNRWLTEKNYDYNDFRITIEREILNEILETTNLDYSSTKQISIDVKNIRKCLKRLYRLNLTKSLTKKDKTQESYLSTFIRNESKDLNLLKKIDEEKKLKIKDLLSTFDKIVDIIKIQSSIQIPYQSIRDKYKDWRVLIISDLELDYNNENRKIIKEYISLEDDVINEKEHAIKRLSILSSYPIGSSGEQNMLALFSRIHEYITRVNRGYDIRNSFILLLDEAESGFHPEWQRKLLKKLLDYLNSIPEDFKFQLIFTTHSPYLLSDLASENLILLQKGKDGLTIKNNSLGKNTFAANIHELLADSFFLNNGFIGGYSKSIIEDLIKYLKSSNEDNKNWDHAKAREHIKIVGDDIIRMRLEDLYEQKFSTPLKSVDDEILLLQSRIDNLKSLM